MSTESHPLFEALQEADRCIQCGFCLPACPTYRLWGEEKHSPRGRIQLVRSWAEGETDFDESVQDALDACLDCRACETACPIDLRYGVVLAGARDEMLSDGPKVERRPRPRWKQWMIKAAIRHVASRPRRMRFAIHATHKALHSPPGCWMRRIADKRPDSWIAQSLPFAAALSGPRGDGEAGKPLSFGSGSTGIGDDQCPPSRADSPPLAMSRGAASRRTTALFLGCAQEGMFPESNRATESLLRMAGRKIAVPEGQVCCGALARHQGDKHYARKLLRQNFAVFGLFEDEGPYDTIVMNAGGCMAWFKEAATLFEEGTPEWTAARRLADRVRDVSEVLTEDDFPPPGSSRSGPRRIVYQPSCHLSHVCGVTEEPLAMLRRAAGPDAEIMLPTDGGSCCGSAGIYNVLQPKRSRQILERKMEAIAARQPDVIITSNPGCHLQMIAGVKQCGMEDKVQVRQLAEFVHETSGCATVAPVRPSSSGQERP